MNISHKTEPSMLTKVLDQQHVFHCVTLSFLLTLGTQLEANDTNCGFEIFFCNVYVIGSCFCVFAYRTKPVDFILRMLQSSGAQYVDRDPLVDCNVGRLQCGSIAVLIDLTSMRWPHSARPRSNFQTSTFPKQQHPVIDLLTYIPVKYSAIPLLSSYLLPTDDTL